MLVDARRTRVDTYLSSLVLGDLVLGVLFASLALAVGASGLGNVDLTAKPGQRICSRGLSHRETVPNHPALPFVAILVHQTVVSFPDPTDFVHSTILSVTNMPTMNSLS